MLTETNRRPSDADLEAVKDAVIEAARNTDSVDLNLVIAVAMLDHIEEQREMHPAIIEGERLSGWDFRTIADRLTVDAFGRFGTPLPTDIKTMEQTTCEHCGRQGLRCETVYYPDGLNTRLRNLAVCDTCGYVYEW